MRCFLLGADMARDAWIVDAIRSRHFRVVDVPHCNLLKIHLIVGSICEIQFDGQLLHSEDRLFFLRMPQLPMQINDVRRDFAYSEWQAAVEAALYGRPTQVVNGVWALNNFGLRGSDIFWTRVCQRECSAGDVLRFEWPGESRGCSVEPFPSIEVTVTRRRWAGELPLLYEVERHESSLLAIQEILRCHRLDFLRVWIDPSPGPIRITRASAELPNQPSISFETVLDDFL